ncbi:uncharacterized protein LOC123867328 [Maniola jurtina]|uniref:uncharacterized protein LOC123867328 n=1 Tax=Maniola jurtina TaxID=191418 RepID=UPI001E68AF0F|nr:uncharacterized protein LOC123867328 [Maniola jurtina]
MDDGSTITLIDENLAEILELDGPRDPMWVQGLNETVRHENSRRVDVKIRGRFNEEEFTLRNARTVQRLMFTKQNIEQRELRDCVHLQKIEDKLIYKNASPKILIGQDNWELLLALEIRTGRRDQPVASNTRLGWVLHGCRTSYHENVAFCGHIILKEQDNKMENMRKEFFNMEALGISPRRQKSNPEERAMKIQKENSRRLPDGRFETSLLWKQDDFVVPNNYDDAFKRLKILEKKSDRDPVLKEKYDATKRKRTKPNPIEDPNWTRGRKIEKDSSTSVKRREKRKFVHLESDYVLKAEKLWVREVQAQSYASERERIIRGNAPGPRDKLASLSVYLENDGLIRLRGRIKATTEITMETVNPALLDGKHKYTKMYIQCVHEKMHHGGVELTVNELRQRYWITRIRPTVKSVIRSCQICKLRKTKPMTPSTGDLPPARLTASGGRVLETLGEGVPSPATTAAGALPYRLSPQSRRSSHHLRSKPTQERMATRTSISSISRAGRRSTRRGRDDEQRARAEKTKQEDRRATSIRAACCDRREKCARRTALRCKTGEIATGASRKALSTNQERAF